MKVKLTYFKPSGKYYASGRYESNATEFYAICDEVREMLKAGVQPGLVDNATEFDVHAKIWTEHGPLRALFVRGKNGL